MGKRILHSLSIFLIFPAISFGMDFIPVSEDTIPPVILQEATSLETSCDDNTESNFAVWYNDSGGMQAMDNSGNFTVGQTISFLDALDTLNNGSEGFCGNNVFLTIGFFAVDDCGNSSDTTYALFNTFDIVKPEVLVPSSDKQAACGFGIADTLETWLQSSGGAIAEDQCGGVIWDDYIWNDSEGNNGFGKLSEETEIEINRTNCDWSVTVSFFVRDDCQNLSVTTGQFSIIDTLAPIVDPLPVDLTVQCNAIPSLNTYQVVDGCDGLIAAEISEETTQHPDPDSCNHYQFEIARKWVFEDRCGNMDSMFQSLVIIDTLEPQVNYQNSISVSCSADLNDVSLFLELEESCGMITVEFEDGPIINNICVDEFDRAWTLTDICGNTTSFSQNIQLQDNESPIINIEPENLIITCGDVNEIDDQVNAWMMGRGGAEATDACTNLNSFVAIPGSYDINDPTSFPGSSFSLTFDELCVNVVGGIFYEQIADFVYFDGCGNAVASQALVQIVDDMAPLFNFCPDDLVIQLEGDDCLEDIILDVPIAADNCIQYPIIILDTIANPITSPSPGDASVLVDSLQYIFGPYEGGLNDQELGSISILINNLDANSMEEYFIIEIEGTVVDSTPILLIECSDTSYVLNNFDENLWSEWLADDILEINLYPNQPIQEVLGVNDVCPGARVDFMVSLPSIETLDISYAYALNEGEEIGLNGESEITFPLAPGEHLIEIYATDCAGNRNTCETQIEIVDIVPPEISCPANQTYEVGDDECSINVVLPADFVYSDNCLGESVSTLLNPESIEQSYLQFDYDEDNDLFFANDVVFDVAISSIDGKLYEPKVSVEYLADFTENAGWELYDENGNLLGSFTTSNHCARNESPEILIEIADFEAWILDGNIGFTLTTTGNVRPCGTVNDDNIDENSFAQLKLVYQEVLPGYEMTGDTLLQGDFVAIDNAPALNLEVGFYNVVYEVQDNSENSAFCEFTIEVLDQQLPSIACVEAATVEIDPSGLVEYELTELVFVESFADNCPGTNISFEPASFSCDNIDTEELITVTIEDGSGNINTCQTLVNIRPFDLELTFSSGLCVGDTLQLASNIPDPPLIDAYQYNWTGPNGFVSNEKEPFIISPDASYSGTYILEVEGFNSCFTSSSIEVLVEQLADPIIEASQNNICKGETILLNSTSYTGGVSYSWYEGLPPNGILFQESNGPVIEISPIEGDHQYYVVVEGAECVSNASEVIELSVVAKPEASVNDFFINVCDGEPIVFSSDVFDANYTYFWFGPNGYTGSGQFPEGIEESDESNQGSYSLYIEDSGCLSDTTSFQVTVFAKPVTPIINGETILCEGGNFFLSVSNITNADQYIWFKDGVLFSTVNDANSLMVEDAQSTLSGAWEVIAKVGNCESDLSSSFNVSVEAQIPLGANNEGPVCVGDSVQLNATFVPDASYLWTSPNSETFSGQRPKVLALQGEYSVTVTSSNGCTSDAVTFVDLIDIPTITSLSNSAPNCLSPNTDIQFFATVFPPGNYQYVWTGPNNFNSVDPSPIIENVGLNQNGVYTLQLINNGCPSEEVSTSVSMVLNPVDPVILDIGSACVGDDLVLETNYAMEDNCTFNWQTPIGQITNETGTLNIFEASINDAGDYSVTVNKAGCNSVSSTEYMLEIFAIPSPPSIIGTDVLCVGETIILEAFNETGDIVWSGPNNFTNEVNIVEIPNADLDNEGEYTVTLEVNGCVSDPSSPFFVDVLEDPEPIINSEIQDTICRTNSANWEYCFDGIQVDTFDFVQVYTEQDVYVSDLENGCISIDLSTSGESMFSFYFVSFKDDCSSLPSAFLNVEIFDDISLIASIDEDSLYMCDTILFDLRANIPSSDLLDIAWSSNTNDVKFTDSTSMFTDVILQDFGTYEVYLETSNQRCGLIGRDTLKLVYEDDIRALDELVFVDLESEKLVDLFANDESVNEFTASIITEPSEFEIEWEVDGINIITNKRFLGQDSFRYEICSNECPSICDEALVVVRVGNEADCFISNVLTPNNDGFNDYFEIPCLNTRLYPDNKLIIFNQWGDEVYRAQPYENDWAGEFNGNVLPADTYFYIIDFGTNREPIQGFIVLHE